MPKSFLVRGKRSSHSLRMLTMCMATIDGTPHSRISKIQIDINSALLPLNPTPNTSTRECNTPTKLTKEEMCEVQTFAAKREGEPLSSISRMEGMSSRNISEESCQVDLKAMFLNRIPVTKPFGLYYAEKNCTKQSSIEAEKVRSNGAQSPSFLSAGALPHVKGPLPQSSYNCQLCKNVFLDAFSLAQHKCAGIKHIEHRCPECEKVFSCPANLASHRRWHRPRSPTTNKPRKQIEGSNPETPDRTDLSIGKAFKDRAPTKRVTVAKKLDFDKYSMFNAYAKKRSADHSPPSRDGLPILKMAKSDRVPSLRKLSDDVQIDHRMGSRSPSSSSNAVHSECTHQDVECLDDVACSSDENNNNNKVPGAGTERSFVQSNGSSLKHSELDQNSKPACGRHYYRGLVRGTVSRAKHVYRGMIESDVFTCNVCGIALKSFSDFEEHMMEHYNGFLSCHFCRLPFGSVFELQRHVARKCCLENRVGNSHMRQLISSS